MNLETDELRWAYSATYTLLIRILVYNKYILNMVLKKDTCGNKENVAAYNEL